MERERQEHMISRMIIPLQLTDGRLRWRLKGASESTWTVCEDTETHGEGAFSHQITGLMAYIEYEYQAWASNVAGAKCGGMEELKLLMLP